MNNKLLPCPFERGQVWKNPDDMMMMVIMVDLDENGWVVDYVTERGQKGWFNNLDRAIIENCELLHRATPQIDVEDVKNKAVKANNEIHFSLHSDHIRWVIDYLAAKYDFAPKKGIKND